MQEREKTELEKVLDANKDYALVRDAGGSPEEIQVVLDRIAADVCRAVGAQALVSHMQIAYERTARVYAANPEHEDIPDGLLCFMRYLKEGNRVLDLGCGSGRDAIFMALRDLELRKAFMGRMKDGKTAVERFGVPRQSLCVVGIDGAPAMAHAAVECAWVCGLSGVGTKSSPAGILFVGGVDMHAPGALSLAGKFDGVWSCAALFMHTPQELIKAALTNVAGALHGGGIFGVCYINNGTRLPYDNLRYSRTGEIKYFSRPTATQITVAAESLGFLLREESYSDLAMAGEVKKNFFVTQIFQK
jgi:SAM-dependent methyltransferase